MINKSSEEEFYRMIASIRESANAQTPSDKFRAQSRLIRDSHQVGSTFLRK